MGSKFNFSQWKTYFSHFIGKFLGSNTVTTMIQIWDFLCCISKFSPIHKKTLRFLNVALAGLLNFSQFKAKEAVLPNCYQFTKELGKWVF